VRGGGGGGVAKKSAPLAHPPAGDPRTPGPTDLELLCGGTSGGGVSTASHTSPLRVVVGELRPNEAASEARLRGSERLVT